MRFFQGKRASLRRPLLCYLLHSWCYLSYASGTRPVRYCHRCNKIETYETHMVVGGYWTQVTDNHLRIWAAMQRNWRLMSHEIAADRCITTKAWLNVQRRVVFLEDTLVRLAREQPTARSPNQSLARYEREYLNSHYFK